MKTRLIIINWLLSFTMLSYVGEDIVIAIALVAWFGTACNMLIAEGRKVKIHIYLFEKKIFHILKIN